MKIAIALTAASSQISGVQRHAINLARCLLTRNEITAVHLIFAPWQEEFVRSAAPQGDERLHLYTSQLTNTSFSRNLWYYAKLPGIVEQLEADIVHLAYPMPFRRRAYRCPSVVTLHDLYPFDVPANFGFPKVLFNQFLLEQCLSAADAIACVSRSTLARLERIEPRLALGKAVVIWNCIESQLKVSSHSPLPQWKGEPFLLCVAQHRRNKNILFLLRVFRRLLLTRRLAPGSRLVIVGIGGPETKAILHFLAAESLADRVVLLNGISDEELQWCYRKCDLLIAPSLIEGFGLPIAEALLAGCPVVCSDIPAFRELGGEHCNYIPLDSEAELAFTDAIHAVCRQSRCEPVALPQLSAPNIGEEYVQLYQSLLRVAPACDALPLKASISTSRRNSTL